MSQKLDTVSRFSPGNCAPELLESMLVGRSELVGRLEKSVLDSIKTGAGHNWLFIGPRGVGKTHLLAILYNRIDMNPEIRARVAIAYMKEEERGVASFLDWHVRILHAFHRRGETPPADGDIDLGKGLENLKKLPLEQAQSTAERLLLRFVADRQLLLIVENLGEIFDEVKGMGRKGQRRFRDLVQQYPFWTIIASSQALFEDVQAREAPFYGFFKVSHLGMFDLDEAIDLLKRLAIFEGRKGLREFLETDVGRGRVRAIHQLTGGNPRLLVIFYQFVDRESIEDLTAPFLEMVDDLTSYYQEQMQPLPALQQKIVAFLCEHRAAATVKEIAQSCFITHQTASKQLSRLGERRYVVATTVGRESFYELREPLFRICFEIKENLGYPIRLFVDFLGMFYSTEELKRKYRSANLLRSIYMKGGIGLQTKPIDVELSYLGEALSVYHSATLDDIETEIAPLCAAESETISKTVEEFFSERDYRDAVKLVEAAYSLNLVGPAVFLKGIEGRRKMGDLPGARKRANRLAHSDPENVAIWIEKAEIEMEEKDFDAAEESYQRTLDLGCKDKDVLVKLGAIKGSRKEYSEAIHLLSEATQIAPDDPRAWFILGVLQKEDRDLTGARRSYKRLTDLVPQSMDAWMQRGGFLLSQGEHDQAAECFVHVVELRPNYGEGWRILGLAQQYSGDATSTRQSYEKATELAPQSAVAWEQRGRFLLVQGELDTALKCFERVVELRSDYGEGWLFLGISQLSIGQADAAKQSYGKAIDLIPHSADAWECQGRLILSQGEYSKALGCLRKVVELRSDYGEGWMLLGFAQEKAGDTEAAKQSYKKATDSFPQSVDAWKLRGWFLWGQREYEGAIKCFDRITELCPDQGETWNVLGLAQLISGALDSAETSINKFADLAPDQFSPWYSRVLVAMVRGEWEASQEYLKMAENFAESIDQLKSIGEQYYMRGSHAEAIRCYRRVLELEPRDCEATFKVALAYFASSEMTAGTRQLEAAAETGGSQNWSTSMPLYIAEIHEHLLQKIEIHELASSLSSQRMIFDEPPQRGYFIQGLTGALMELLKNHDQIPEERLISIRDRVIPELTTTEELSVACRLFATGVSYLETRDRRVLLRLPREERQSLEELLNAKQTPHPQQQTTSVPLSRSTSLSRPSNDLRRF